jgi:DEAD/DEAH box helicase domain-containing protein
VSAQSKPTSALYKLLDGLARRDRQVVWVQSLPARPARFAEPAAPLSAPVAAALSRFGVEKLYTHQARALDRARAGEHTVVVTGTASGKTLCYNLPVLETLLGDPGARALYLFPTKALAQDQLKGLKRFLGEEEDEETSEAGAGTPRRGGRPGGRGEGGLFFRAGTYDGDTPPTLRRRLRDEANVLLTNPDMLHSGILPHHARWAEFFARLQYVVIDEIHVYRGIFGSHVANVMHRLRRICRHHGSNPIFLCASATIANPRELAERLTGLPSFAVVDEDGSPRGTKHFLFWNPPRLGPAGMERRSANAEAREILVKLVRDGYQAIVFVKTRAMTEVLLRDTRAELRDDGGGLAKKVRSYRAGYLPEERRKIEAALFNNELLGVISTNALELGIDVGSLDAAVIVGYPGTIASTWQQAGRAGRRESESAAVLIGHNAPIDQYLMTNPEYFFERSPEHAVLDRGNPHILLSHLRCAAFEIPLSRQEEPEFGGLTPGILDLLEEHKHVREIRGRWYYSREDYPAANVSLRNASQNAYTILDASASRDGDGEQGKNRVIGTVDEGSAFWQVHPQAVYMHDGETYFVDKLDLSERTAYVHKADLDYYTQAVSDTRVDAADADLEKTWRRAELCFGPCSVLDKLTMFKKIRFGGRDSLGFGQVSLPHTTLRTTGLWLRPHAEALEKVVHWGRVPADGLQGIANVLSYTVSLHAMCDPLDIGTVVDMRAPTGPVLYLYDKYPGGLGYAQRAWHLIEEVMRDALALIRRCECDDGCPSCVGSPLLPQYQQDPDAEMKGRIPDKDAALILLHALLEEPDYEPKMPLTGTALARAQRILAAAAGALEAGEGGGGADGAGESGSADAVAKRKRRRARGGAGADAVGGEGGPDLDGDFDGDGDSGDDNGSGREGGGRGGKRKPLPARVRVKLPDDLRVKLEEQLQRIEESPRAVRGRGEKPGE